MLLVKWNQLLTQLSFILLKLLREVLDHSIFQFEVFLHLFLFSNSTSLLLLVLSLKLFKSFLQSLFFNVDVVLFLLHCFFFVSNL